MTIHVKLIGEDWWGNPVYKCIENGRLYKDVDWIPDKPHLHTFDNTDFDGEAEFPIRADIEVIVIKEEETND